MMVLAWFPGDSVLLLATALLAGGLALGHRAGGLRLALLCSAGLLSAGAAPWLRHAMPDFLLPDHPLSRLMGADFAWAFALAFLFLGLVGQLLHEPLATKLHAHWPADRQEAWQRLNHRLGLVLGGGLSICASWMILTLTLPLGFLANQIPAAQPQQDPLSQRWAARLYRAGAALGLTPVARWLDPVPADFYTAAEVAGVVYQNCSTNNLMHIRQFRSRLLGYPGLVDSAHHPRVAQLAHVWTTNTFFMGLHHRTNLHQLLVNPQLKAAWTDPDLSAQIAQVDLLDLRTYLQTGQSAQYAPHTLALQGRAPLLGSWRLDASQTLAQFKSRYPKMNAAERTALEHYFQELATDLALSFSDGTCYLEGRTFPERALGQTATAQRENVSPRDFLPVIPESASGRPIQLLAQGAWEKKPGGSYKTHWKWGTAASPVLLQMFPDRLLLTVESLRGEKYVFQRPRL